VDAPMRKHGFAVPLALALAVGLAGCGGGGEPSADGTPSGEITVLTQRTDIVDTVFADYKKRFEAKYPRVTVKFEAITDYEGEVRIRMSTKDYGDVLLIPNSVTADQLPDFFEPLGTVEDMSKKYRFVTEHAFNGQVYGIAITGNAQGLVYNKKIWQQAGVTSAPKSPDEFRTDLRAIKAKTSAIPLYTNYKDGWPLTQWEGARGAVSANPDAVNKLADSDSPWAPGQEHNIIDSLLYDVVHDGLTEADPTTTNWEGSKKLLGTGKIATMLLGSWAITQMQKAATDPADIGYLPFPVQVNGRFHSVIGGDYHNAVNINSKHKAAARAWVDWFANESGYAASEGGIAPVKDNAFPKTLADLQAVGTEFIELTPAPAGKEGLVQRIDTAAEVGLFEPNYRKRLVDSARGASKESKDDIFTDLNNKWATARAKTN
jgi:raffinose/stachyose/melibiose transport system substrate-binding protein